jgi:uncharacterized RDD family membrane protein YckC
MVFCKRCGAYSAKGSTACQGCQADLTAFGHESMSGSSPVLQAAPGAVGGARTLVDLSNYGSFLNRLLAIIIDGLIMVVGTVVPYVLIALALMAGRKPEPNSLSPLLSMGVGFALATLAIACLPVVYEVVMIGKRGATFGKAFRKLKVVRTNGEPVSMGRSVLRVIIKLFLSGILLIGYLMALFTEKKQALHDLMADTVVVHSDG